jgi:hypothetical protein
MTGIILIVTDYIKICVYLCALYISSLCHSERSRTMTHKGSSFGFAQDDAIV